MSLVRSAVGAARTAVDGAVAWGGMAVSDLVHLRRALEGNDVDAWDPDYIRRVLPLWRAFLGTYFRGEVRGLENVPDTSGSLLTAAPVPRLLTAVPAPRSVSQTDEKPQAHANP